MRDKGKGLCDCFRIRALSSLGMRGRLMFALIPSVVVILLASGMGNYEVSEQYINVAVERFVRLQNLAAAHEVERYFEQVRRDLLFAARGGADEASLRRFLADTEAAGGISYLECAYVAPSGDGHVAMFRHDGRTVHMDERLFLRVTPNPLLLFEQLDDLEPGEVWASPVTEVRYPSPMPGRDNAVVSESVIRFVTPCAAPGGGHDGLLMLAVDARAVRDILSLFNSEQSPLWAFARSDELRYDYLVDKEGWMLFQSSAQGAKGSELTTYLARSGFEGTLGRPGLRGAFRPNAIHGRYWEMVEHMRQGQSGLARVEDPGSSSTVDDYYFAYAPVHFSRDGKTPGEIYGAVVRVDRSILPVVAGYHYLDVMLVVTVSAIVVIALLIYWLGQKLTAPMRLLAARLNQLGEVDDFQEVKTPYGGRDIEELKVSVNALVRRIAAQVEEIRQKDETILNVNLRESADLAREQARLDTLRLEALPELIGTGPRVATLKSDVLKAAQVDVDVLVSGETGTGKQLVAEAIHASSARAGGPFISINCGALDENLLLDALFGHVKGAFSEAKSDRNGAFLEAAGGTLFLDEIQSASPKVQQSLLRALSIRKIKPLGSDVEVPTDVRIIAAANVDLTDLIEQGLFREDLYYRLKVVSIRTPALREHPESIPLLALFYLQQAQQLAGHGEVTLSKGVLRKLAKHTWPGNIRELINCITRAVVMAESGVIQAEEIKLESDMAAPDGAAQPEEQPAPEPAADPEPQPHPRPLPREREAQDVHAEPTRPRPDNDPHALNPRQRKAWGVITRRGTVTRGEYQDLVGGDLSPRTANYDLNDLVAKGLLVKEGKGPATRYVVAA